MRHIATSTAVAVLVVAGLLVLGGCADVRQAPVASGAQGSYPEWQQGGLAGPPTPVASARPVMATSASER